MTTARRRPPPPWIALCLLLLAPASARAQTAAAADPPPRRPLTWNPEWPRFRIWEYAGTAALGIGALVYQTKATSHDQPSWTGGILFDGAVRGWLRADSPSTRASARLLSDRLWMGGTAVPFVIDLPVALLVHRQPGVAWQMAMMDLEAYAVSGFLNRVLEYEVARARPSAADCAADPGYDELCGSSANNASFPSGHTLGIATAAGLTCVHHQYLPLYGHPLADGAACVVMSTATVATGIARMVGDRHHASDVLFGAALGFGAGYGIPWLLHYRNGVHVQKEGPRTVLLPWAAPTGVGAAVVGTL
jgi:membrane-associated phospholipid phosphatase